MAKKTSSLADLDIEQEGLAQQDGLAERLARQRGHLSEPSRTLVTPAGGTPAEVTTRSTPKEQNAWRKGKALLQVALPEDLHVELGIIAKRRRMTLAQMTREALNAWLAEHHYQIRIPE
jgi:hypothetical protein